MKKSQLEAGLQPPAAGNLRAEGLCCAQQGARGDAEHGDGGAEKLDKMDVIELAREKPKPEFTFRTARTSGKLIFETEDLVIGYDEPLSRASEHLAWSAVKKSLLSVQTGLERRRS